MLSLDDLRKEAEDGGDRHDRHRLHRHAGPPVRQAHPGGVLPRRRGRARRRGLQLPARARHGDGPVPGYEMANWEGGYGDFAIVPDMATLRRIPWLDRTALVLCDVANHDGSPVVASPRQVLIAQYERAHAMGYTPMFASELEFYLYKESYAEAHERDYRDLTPTIPYILDYHILATTMDEQYLGPIRRGMHAAGIPVEFSKGEAWYGQHEVNTRYADAVTSADRHTIYKNGVKEIAFLNGISATFMAKPSEKDIGSSCHIHSSLVAAAGGKSVFVDGHAGDRRLPPLPRRAARPDQGAGAARRALDQLLQALRDRELGADLDLVGPRQPHLRLPGRRSRRIAAGRVPDPRRRRQPVPRLCGAAGGGPRRHRAGHGPGAGAEGQRVRRGRGRAVPVDAARGGRPVGGQRLRAQDVRRGRVAALPQLRQDRAAAVRRGRHGLRAPPHVRARLADH